MRVYLSSVRRSLPNEPFFETVVGVRSLRGDRALWACVGLGDKGASLALLAAVAWCSERNHLIVGSETAERPETSSSVDELLSGAAKLVREPAANDALRARKTRKDAA